MSGDLRSSPSVLEDESRRQRSRQEALVRHLGEPAVARFLDEAVTEVYVNDDGRLWETRAGRRVETSVVLAPETILRFLHTVATSRGESLDSHHPTLQAELPDAVFGGARLQAQIPPVTRGPAFNLRKLAARVWTFDDYEGSGLLTGAQRQAIEAGIHAHHNTVVIGGTDSGKTTFLNGLLHEIHRLYPDERIVTIEDTRELRSPAPDHLALRTSEGVQHEQLVAVALRSSPDRIGIGEVRTKAALHLLDAWTTGHPGGFASLHAEDPLAALHRLNRLAQWNQVPDQSGLVGSAVHLLVLVRKASHDRRRHVASVTRVDGFHSGAYRLLPVA